MLSLSCFCHKPWRVKLVLIHVQKFHAIMSYVGSAFSMHHLDCKMDFFSYFFYVEKFVGCSTFMVLMFLMVGCCSRTMFCSCFLSSIFFSAHFFLLRKGPLEMILFYKLVFDKWQLTKGQKTKADYSQIRKSPKASNNKKCFNWVEQCWKVSIGKVEEARFLANPPISTLIDFP